MLALEDLASGTEKPRLLIHLPGFNTKTVRTTPLLELYKAGHSYSKALDTLVTEAAAGRVHPDHIEEFKAKPGLTLAGADAWLDALLSDAQGGFATQLQRMKLTAVFDELLTSGDSYIAGRINEPDDRDALWAHLDARLGLPRKWRETIQTPTMPRPDDVAFAAASWALCIEYVNDLKRPPVSPHLGDIARLPNSLVQAGCELSAHLRRQHVRFYRRTADEIESLVSEEVAAANAQDLGKIDTFRFEEDTVRKSAIDALAAADWARAESWAALRIDEQSAHDSVWLSQDVHRRSAWLLIQAAAQLGQAILRASNQLIPNPTPAPSLADAIDAYRARGAAVDLAHRHVEQRRTTLLDPRIPEFERLRDCLDSVRQAWRDWADSWAREFNALCSQHGFLPDPSLQQRTLFDDVVRPLADGHQITAYFVVDALRFEMGQELQRQLHLRGTPPDETQLTARLAELPTVTEVGMNLLAPVAGPNGRVRTSINATQGKITGFQSGEFRVNTPKKRQRAMRERVGGNCPLLPLLEFDQRDLQSLKHTIKNARLVIVHHEEIDKAGELFA